MTSGVRAARQDHERVTVTWEPLADRGNQILPCFCILTPITVSPFRSISTPLQYASEPLPHKRPINDTINDKIAQGLSNLLRGFQLPLCYTNVGTY